MDDPLLGPPIVSFPGPLDRRMRLGPFPSGRDALKFVAYAAVGAIFAPTPYPMLAVPIVLAGLLVTLWKPGGEGIDERLAVLVKFAVRRGRRSAGPRPAPVRSGLRSSVVSVGAGSWAAVVRTGGVPVAFLPPLELARRFDLYRELLRSLGSDWRFLATAAPIFTGPLVPGSPSAAAPDRAARLGYQALVQLLCRRRAVRQIYVALTTSGERLSSSSQLEQAAQALEHRLEGLGVRAERLHGRVLMAAVRRLGLRGPGEAG